ncbi:DUF1642 domain-containing protein [Jeotgalibaca porci]|uniref:DUF1642 domain-containing protein n=1 Tax=Jeotgalibaca porci TaxID=1868793 RepID=UPI0035A08872
MNEQISTIQTREALELMRNLAPILNQKELFEFMLFSNRVLERYMSEHYNDGLSEGVTEMRKDKAWLRDEVSELYPSYDEMYMSPDHETVAKTETISNVLELIDQLDEPEKPVIPQFVADYIELNKGWSEDRQEYIEDDNSGLWSALDGNSYGMPNSVSDWLFNEEQVETFAKAWLDGYEVEKEKLYRVRAGNRYVRFNLDGSIIGVKKDNSIVCLEHLSKLPFDYKKAVESGIITLEEVTE